MQHKQAIKSAASPLSIALITGRSSDILRAGAAGVAVGGSAGAVSGAFHNNKANPVYRQFDHAA